MGATFLSMFEQQIELLRLRAEQRELLVIDDLFNGLEGHSCGIEIFHLDGRLGPDGGLETISPGLSFKWTSSGLEKYATAERLRKAVKDFQVSHLKLERADLENSSLLLVVDDCIRDHVVHLFKRAVALLVTNSLNARNKYQDNLDKYCRELAQAVEDSGGTFGMGHLVRFLNDVTDREFGLMHLSNRALTVLPNLSSEGSCKMLARFIDLPENAFLPDSSGRSTPFPAMQLPQSTGSDLISNAAVWGKPMASRITPEIRVLIIPITRPLERREAHHEGAGVPAADLLFTFTPDLDQWLIDVVYECVDTFSAHRYGARRFNLLAELQSSASNDDIVASDNAGEPRHFGTIDVRRVLNEVLYTTSAHSVSLRVYDPSKRSLEIVASVAGEFEFVSQEMHDGIQIKDRGATSVVAFTFLHGTSEMPYVYLKKIAQPIEVIKNDKLKRRGRTFIPPEYRSKGLQSPKITRPLTRSEICFVLLDGRLPFGTLNIEAPFPSAFDQDIAYLSLIKTALEKAYASVRQKIDSRWLIANTARSESVHQLWQYQEQGGFFNEHQNRALEAIFPPRSEHDPVGARQLSSLKARLIDWAQTRYDGTLQADVIAMIKFDHLGDMMVSAEFSESALVIAKNVIQNAVKHGEPKHDLIFIDDRPWFAAREIPCLRILYRSSNRVPIALIQDLGKRPIYHSGSLRTAYGLYNVGLLTRLLGGTFHAFPNDEGRLLTEIHLPIAEATSEETARSIHRRRLGPRPRA